MDHLPNSTYNIVQVCLLARKIMLENGGKTYRVEDTMTRISDAFGIKHSHSFVTPTVRNSIPEGFPKEIPISKGAVLTGSMKTSQNGGTTYTVSDTADQSFEKCITL